MTTLKPKRAIVTMRNQTANSYLKPQKQTLNFKKQTQETDQIIRNNHVLKLRADDEHLEVTRDK